MAGAEAVLGTTRKLAIEAGVDLENIPAHVAIIMDGNGRWAQSQGRGRLEGHAEGHLALRDTLAAAADLGVRYLTVYGFSAENWRRPADEVSGIMDVIVHAARAELQSLVEQNVRVRLSGRIAEMPPDVVEHLRELEEGTRHCTGIVFVLALNYGGRAEIVDAVRALVREGLDPEQVDEQALSARLYLPDVPDPDLVVRTSGEQRWSNFLMWQSAYAELVVRPEPWPEFRTAGLVAAIAEYQQRERRFGGLNPG
jgi:undecaprenyl diphosphate synthase